MNYDTMSKEITNKLPNRMQMALLIEGFEDYYKDMFALVDKVLSEQAKEFFITYRGTKYHFRYVFDDKEALNLAKKRHKFIDTLLRDSIRYAFSVDKDKRDHAWDNIEGIISGACLSDHQFEKVHESEVSETFDADGNRVTAYPLNLDNYQVKENLGMLDVQQD